MGRLPAPHSPVTWPLQAGWDQRESICPGRAFDCLNKVQREIHLHTTKFNLITLP